MDSFKMTCILVGLRGVCVLSLPGSSALGHRTRDSGRVGLGASTTYTPFVEAFAAIRYLV